MEESILLFYHFLLSWHCRRCFKDTLATFFFFCSQLSGHFLSHEEENLLEKPQKIPPQNHTPCWSS